MIKIDYEAIRNNISKLKNSDYIILKSNAYGFGFKEVLEIAIDEGMYKFGVIDLEYAIYIKTNYPNIRVLLLGPVNKEDIGICERYQIEVTITNVEDVEILNNYNLDVQIEINSGMNRFGIEAVDIDRTLNLINPDKLKLVGVYSHNATKNLFNINNQLEAFYYGLKNIGDVDIHFLSTTLKDMNIKRQTSRRIGEFIYSDALTVFGKIISIKYVEEGEYVGYDYSYQMKFGGYIGVIDIGYSDGLERNCDGFLVFIDNAYYPLVGKSCMNYSFVLLESDLLLGYEAQFIGKSNKIKNYEIKFNKISHEIFVSFLKRF